MADFTALKTAILTYIKQNGNEEITGAILQEILLSVVTTLGDGAINDLITALTAEVNARQQADGTLQQNINTEANTRANADTALSNRLGSTITSENTAADQIGAEAETRAAADTALQGLIDGITDNIDNGYVYAGIATPSSTPVTGKVYYLALTAGTYTNFGSTVVTQGINILKYNGSAWSLDAFIGIDDTPTPNSQKLVKSGGAFDSVMTNGSAFDISAHFASGGTLATYADLNAALTALNTLSADYKRDGMSIKFVQSSDNKYVQYRLMAVSFSTTVSDWQGVDDEPTAGSENLVKSQGVLQLPMSYRYKKGFTFNGSTEVVSNSWGVTDYIPIKLGDVIEFNFGGHDNPLVSCNSLVYDSQKVIKNGFSYPTNTNLYSFTSENSSYAYIRLPFNMNYKESVYLKINGKIVWVPQLEKSNVESNMYFTRRGCISYPSARDGVMAPFLNIDLYMGSGFSDKTYYLSFIGYNTDGMVMFGIKDVDNNTQYYGYTTNFTQPESGIGVYGIILNTGSVLSYAEITIDWSLYSSFVNSNNTTLYKDILITPKPLSSLKKIAGQYINAGEITAITLENVNLIGDNIQIDIKRDVQRFVLNKNVTLKGIHFVYVGTGAITSRSEMEDGYGNLRLEPLISQQNLEDDDIGVIGSTASFLVINSNSEQVVIKDCVFEGFNYTCIYNTANGRHISGNHTVISGCEFIFCKIGIYLMEEFARCFENLFQGCVFGIVCAASDINLRGNKFLRNDVGMYFRSNNDAYGFANGCTFVHCGIASVYAHSVPVFMLEGCFIVQAPVICLSANGLSVANSQINSYFVISSGAKCRIINNMMNNTYAAIDGVENIFDVPADTIISGNRAYNSSQEDSLYNV